MSVRFISIFLLYNENGYKSSNNKETSVLFWLFSYTHIINKYKKTLKSVEKLLYSAWCNGYVMVSSSAMQGYALPFS